MSKFLTKAYKLLIALLKDAHSASTLIIQFNIYKRPEISLSPLIIELIPWMIFTRNNLSNLFQKSFITIVGICFPQVPNLIIVAVFTDHSPHERYLSSSK